MITNNFQKTVEKYILNKLSSLNKVIKKREIRGSKDIYIELAESNVCIWIYDDGAEITGKDIDSRFEIIDYNNEEELIIDFTSYLEKALIK
jgi:hypothetical protein